MVTPHFHGLYSSKELCCEGPWFTSIQEDRCDKGAHQSYLGTAILCQFIPANLSGFPGIYPVLTSCLDFPMFIVIFCFFWYNDVHKENKKKKSYTIQSQSKFSKPDVVFCVHAQSIALLAGEVLRYWYQQTLTTPAKSANSVFLINTKNLYSLMSPGTETIMYAFSKVCWHNINILKNKGWNGVNPSLLQRWESAYPPFLPPPLPTL